MREGQSEERTGPQRRAAQRVRRPVILCASVRPSALSHATLAISHTDLTALAPAAPHVAAAHRAL
ncbi:MAG: hypothetical protein Q8Q09_20495, partial [Deltaproteobacteria bacterium]|nr:hypothetical protein [Deltaproteobacteria bacterium]